MIRSTRPRGLAACLVVLGLLAGCSTAESTPQATATQAAGVTVEDAWVKSTDEGMTAAFGVLVNSGGSGAQLVSVSSAASPMIELHETVAAADGQMVMRPKDGGFTIPAGGEYALQPGGNHIMLMGVGAPIKAGDTVVFTLSFQDGSTTEFRAAAKDYTGANEQYRKDHG